MSNVVPELAIQQVRPDTAYRSWGWTKLGELQPFPDALVFDAMIRDLRKQPRRYPHSSS